MADNANETVKVKSNSVSEDKVLTVAATIPLVGLIIYYAMPDASDMVKHYAKQSNAILAFIIVVWLLQWVLFVIPFLGWGILGLLWLIVVILEVLLLIKALQGEKYTLPVVGEYFDKLLK